MLRLSRTVYLRNPISHTSSTSLSHSTNHHLLALSLSLSLSLFQSLSASQCYSKPSLPPIIPALVCLHLYIVGSLVRSTWLYSHFTSLSLSLYHSHLISPATIRPTIVPLCLRRSIHQVSLLLVCLSQTINSYILD